MANNTSSNSGQEYLKFYNSNPNCFKKVPEHCGTFGDLYLQYKNLCDEPFCKKNIIKEWQNIIYLCFFILNLIF